MKAGFYRTYLFTFSFVIGCVAMVMAYQNCSNNAGFNANPSVARPFTNVNPPRIGGNENVVIRLNQYPTDQTLDMGDAVVDYQVTSPNGEIVDVQCTLRDANGNILQNINCGPSGIIPIDVDQLGTGTYTFTIVGTNSQGQVGEEQITFTIFNSIVPMSKTINVDAVNDIADIIINVDNSGSMEYEQQSMANRISNYMDKFKHLNYHISVITTSPASNQMPATLPYNDGKFLQYPDTSTCIDNSVPLTTAQTYLGQTVQRSEQGNGWERGIYMTYRMFERYSGGPCLRQGVAKHVILISDEDETLYGEDGQQRPDPNQPLIEQAKSDGDNLRNYVAAQFPNVAFKFHSIIVDPFSEEGRECLSSHGAKFGSKYGELSKKTGGVIGSVCAQDYASQLEEIGLNISNSSKVYPLGCVAVANGANNGLVTQNGQPIGIGWHFNGDKIEFDMNLPVGTYEIQYYCFQ